MVDELLLAEEVEKRMYETKGKLTKLYAKASAMGGANHNDHKEEIQKLEIDLRAYEIAIDSAFL